MCKRPESIVSASVNSPLYILMNHLFVLCILEIWDFFFFFGRMKPWPFSFKSWYRQLHPLRLQEDELLCCWHCQLSDMFFVFVSVQIEGMASEMMPLQKFLQAKLRFKFFWGPEIPSRLLQLVRGLKKEMHACLPVESFEHQEHLLAPLGLKGTKFLLKYVVLDLSKLST